MEYRIVRVVVIAIVCSFSFVSANDKWLEVSVQGDVKKVNLRNYGTGDSFKKTLTWT